MNASARVVNTDTEKCREIPAVCVFRGDSITRVKCVGTSSAAREFGEVHTRLRTASKRRRRLCASRQFGRDLKPPPGRRNVWRSLETTATVSTVKRISRDATTLGLEHRGPFVVSPCVVPFDWGERPCRFELQAGAYRASYHRLWLRVPRFVWTTMLLGGNMDSEVLTGRIVAGSKPIRQGPGYRPFWGAVSVLRTDGSQPPPKTRRLPPANHAGGHRVESGRPTGL